MKIDYFVKRDHNIMIFLNKNLKCKVMDRLMPILTYLGSTPFVAAFCSFALLFFGRARDSFGFKVSAAVVVSGSLSQILKRTVNRIRPFLILNNLNIKKIGIDDYSFPSGHTCAAFTLAVMILMFSPMWGIFALILALGVGVSRIYLGVHFPTDVMAGMMLGTLVSVSTYLI